MKYRTILVSALGACFIHALILFLNLSVASPTLASAPVSIEVTLVAPPAAPAAEPAPVAPAEPEHEPPEPAPRPEHVAEPEPIPEPEPEPEVVPEPIPEPEFALEAEPPPDMEATRWVTPADEEEISDTNAIEEELVGISEKDATDSPSADPIDDASEAGGSVEGPTTTVDLQPTYTYNPKPRYPRAARRRGQEGTVLLLVEVLASGRVGEVVIEKSSGHELLDNAAAGAVRGWRFEPAKKGGVPVNARVRIPVEFNLKDTE